MMNVEGGVGEKHISRCKIFIGFSGRFLGIHPLYYNKNNIYAWTNNETVA